MCQCFIVIGQSKSRDKIEAKFKHCVARQEYHSALENSFVAAIVTKWDEFVLYDWKAIAEKMMLPAMVFDGRNVINTNKVINQYYIGR